MNTKDQIALLLEQNGDGFISGSTLAKRLGLTRAAVWKCVTGLSGDGYAVESTHRGYRLGPESDAVSENSIRTYLGEYASVFEPEVFREISSTNSYLKEKASDSLHGSTENEVKTWHTVIASAQTAGRGRKGRSFISPPGTGLYLSVLLRPKADAGLAARITTAAAVAACVSIEACTEEHPQIKWVNDIYLRGKKVCGILTEASIGLESGGLDWAVMGIGMNVYEPEESYPEALQEIAGAIAEKRENNLRCRLAASFLLHFHRLCSELESGRFAEEYRERNFLIGRQVLVIRGGEERAATALDVDRECRLSVRYEDGSRETLSSGEVRIRPQRDGGI
ncbi:MAG: biotin--[Lachnospiraceae bacterium]|nr:biotin--[acetyl-CoA-carboxylase] ligase [Lachnospiraceae bacterium]